MPFAKSLILLRRVEVVCEFAFCSKVINQPFCLRCFVEKVFLHTGVAASFCEWKVAE